MKITEITTVKQQITTKIRLAAYCRVSSDSADQLHSFAAQIRYYSEYTAKHPEYELVDIYADEGLTGTEMKKLDELNRLIRDCKKGLIAASIAELKRSHHNSIRLTRDITAPCPSIGSQSDRRIAKKRLQPRVVIPAQNMIRAAARYRQNVTEDGVK